MLKRIEKDKTHLSTYSGLTVHRKQAILKTKHYSTSYKNIAHRKNTNVKTVAYITHNMYHLNFI